MVDDGRTDDATPTHGGNGDAAVCHFNFVFDGKSYSRCTTDGHTKEWCATTENYDRDGKWGLCGEGKICVLSPFMSMTVDTL